MYVCVCPYMYITYVAYMEKERGASMLAPGV